MLEAVEDVTVSSGGTLTGLSSATVQAATLFNAGTIAVAGNGTTGVLTVNGNYTQTTGTLKVDLAGLYVGQYDRLAVSGQATLGGTVIVTNALGYVATPGASFAILTYGSRVGTFATLSLPPLYYGGWDPRYDLPPGTFTLWVTYGMLM